MTAQTALYLRSNATKTFIRPIYPKERENATERLFTVHSGQIPTSQPGARTPTRKPHVNRWCATSNPCAPCEPQK